MAAQQASRIGFAERSGHCSTSLPGRRQAATSTPNALAATLERDRRRARGARVLQANGPSYWSPATLTTLPLMLPLVAEARKTITLATSSAVEKRRCGISWFRIFLTCSAGLPPSVLLISAGSRRRRPRVTVGPGATTLVSTPLWYSSVPSVRLSPWRAILLAM